MNKTLDNIQPGDQVLWENMYSKEICTVERVTKAHIIIHNQKYRKVSGRPVTTDRWNTAHIRPLSPELKEQFQREVLHQRLCSQVKRSKIELLTIEQLQAILGIAQSKSKND